MFPELSPETSSYDIHQRILILREFDCILAFSYTSFGYFSSCVNALRTPTTHLPLQLNMQFQQSSRATISCRARKQLLAPCLRGQDLDKQGWMHFSVHLHQVHFTHCVCNIYMFIFEHLTKNQKNYFNSSILQFYIIFRITLTHVSHENYMIFLCQQKIMFMDGHTFEKVTHSRTGGGWTTNSVVPH